MGIEKRRIAELITFASDRVRSELGYVLDASDKAILEQALQGKRLKDIRVIGLTPGTIETVRAPKLWQLISKAIGQKVGIKNLHLVLHNTWKEQQTGENLRDTSSQLLAPTNPNILENLPAPTCTKFIGRTHEIARLLELLAPNHASHLITVSGIGGLGKTSLVVECARRCLFASRTRSTNSAIPQFEVFLFVSAKLYFLEFDGLIPRPDPSRSLSDILQQIADVLGTTDLTSSSIKEQIRLLKKVLGQRRTLLIVDNLETVENLEEVIGFLYELPPSVKVVMTTREQWQYEPIRLTPLNQEDALHLIQFEVHHRKLSLLPKHYQALYQAARGVPLAVSYMLGQLKSGCLIEEVLEGIHQPTHEVVRFCFENLVQAMRGKPAHQVFMALALLPAPALQNALVSVAIPEADSVTVRLALAHLRKSSLVSQIDCRYSMLSITQEYALAELKAYPEFAVSVRQRWIDWYLRFSKSYIKQDGISWQSQFDGLVEEWQNLQAIANWCIAENRYEAMSRLWRNLEAYTYAMGRDRSRQIYWKDRLAWTDWLIQLATRRSDWKTATEVMVDRAWTLITTRKPELLPEAEQLLQQVWDLKHYQTPQFQIDFALKMAVMRVEQSQFAEAQPWFEKAQELLEQNLSDEQYRLHKESQIQYYRGMCNFKNSECAVAKQRFEVARQKALSLKDERVVRLAENWLADIAIMEGEFDRAEQWLSEGLRMGQIYQDWPHVAFTKRSFAKLHQARGDLKKAKKDAIEALNLFLELEMVHKAEETQIFLDNLT